MNLFTVCSMYDFCAKGTASATRVKPIQSLTMQNKLVESSGGHDDSCWPTECQLTRLLKQSSVFLDSLSSPLKLRTGRKLQGIFFSSIHY